MEEKRDHPTKTNDASKPAVGRSPRRAVAVASAQKPAKPTGSRPARASNNIPHVAKPPNAARTAKKKKIRLVRFSFAMPKQEHDLLSELKKRLLALGVATRKRELLRAAISQLADLDDRAVVFALKRLEIIKSKKLDKSGK